MKKVIKDNWKFLLLVLIGGLVGGYCIGLYSYDSLSPELLKQLEEQNASKELIAVSSMIQYGLIYGLVLAIIGIFLAKKINLWNKFRYDKKAVIITAIFSVISALCLYPLDKLVFGSFNSWVFEQYMTKPSIAKIVGGLLVGGIIEEVMMRLFFMSLIVFIIKKIVYKNKKDIPVKVYIIANIIAALLFAAGHIPSTMTMTTLTPLILFRCFLFNGMLGFCFGYLYRKYNIGYAMISHGLAHLLSDFLMLIFI